MKDFILKFVSKEAIVAYSLNLLLRFLMQKPNGKFAAFITSDEMRQRMRDINSYYASFCEAWDAEQAEQRFSK